MTMFQAITFLSIAQLLSHVLAHQSLEFYTAAVVEYLPLGNPSNGADSVLETNVAAYESYIKEAAAKGADIVVFPEYGLTSTSPSINRVELKKYAQMVPSVRQSNNEVNLLPYEEENVSWVIKRISSSARKNQIYVVINLPELVPCNKTDYHCPNDNCFVYNSNIAFDRDGRIVSKYWKYNLFEEAAVNKPQEASHSTFTTDFNVTFGMFTCFDILWKKPAFDLVTIANVTDFVFPTAWFSQLPFLSAVQIQASWSYGLGVNLLASNYNNPRVGAGGSGIYSGINGSLSTYMPIEAGSKLLIDSVPKIKRRVLREMRESFHNFDQLHEVLDDSLMNTTMHLKYDDLENFNSSLPLKDGNSEAVLCSEEFCCNFYADIKAYNASSSSYRFMMYNGIRYLANQYRSSFKICAIIYCLTDEVHTCGHVPVDNNLDLSFRSLRISGNFQSCEMVLPNSVDYMLKPINHELYDFSMKKEQIQVTSRDVMTNVLSFSIYGRCFQND